MVGTIQPAAGFDAKSDCIDLRAAMKGLGTDEGKIINIMGNRSRSQRLEIAQEFKTMFGKDLGAEFKSELSGNFLRLTLYLLMSIPEFLAKELKRSMKGSGTDERALVEILVGLDNKGIAEVKSTYKKMYDTELEREVVGETSGHFKRLTISLLQGNRHETDEIDMVLAKEDAAELYNAGINRFGTDESKFNSILVSRSYRHLKAVFAEYRLTNWRHLDVDINTLMHWRLNWLGSQAINFMEESALVPPPVAAGEDIEKSIKSEMSGELELGFISIVKKIKNTPTYFAEELYKSMKGLGTDDDQLIRIIVWRSEIDLQEIKGAFNSLYAIPLAGFIKDDTSGDFRNLILKIVK